MTVHPIEQRLEDAARAARTLFPDFDFLGPGGTVDVQVAPVIVNRVRVDLRSPEFLHLQSIGLTTAEGLTPTELAERATVTTSSWHGAFGETFEAVRLFDAAHPTGATIHTLQEEHPWVDIAFDQPVELHAVQLRAIGTRWAIRDRDIRIQAAGADGELRTLYDATRRSALLWDVLDGMAAIAPPDVRDELAVLVTPLGRTITGHYRDARNAMKELKSLSDDTVRAFKRAVNRAVLVDRSLEWTTHGAVRSFRFWSEQERVKYIRYTVGVADELAELTPNVAFGFGAVLAVVRDGDLIPHDDDLDLVVAFEPHEAATLPEAHALVEEFLSARGYTVTGDFFGHRHVGRRGEKKIDVFAGLFEGDRISWYPGTRRALARSTMFPTSRAEMLGVPCPLPAEPEVYLETIYGPGWRHPDPGFKHSWSRQGFLDQAGTAVAVPPVGDPPVGGPPVVDPPDTVTADEPPRGWRSRLRRP